MNTKEQVQQALLELLGENNNEYGFVEDSGVHYIFAHREEFDHGHMLDEDENPIPLPTDRIAGHLANITYFVRQTDFGPAPKLRIDLDTPSQGRFMIEMGFFTNTAKSTLPALAEIDPSKKVTILMDPSDGDSQQQQKVLFTEVLQEDENGDEKSVRADWPQNDNDLIQYYKIVRENVLGLQPEEEQPQPRAQTGGQQSGQSQNAQQAPSQNHNQPPPQSQPAAPPQQQNQGQGQQAPGNAPPSGGRQPAPPAPNNNQSGQQQGGNQPGGQQAGQQNSGQQYQGQQAQGQQSAPQQAPQQAPAQSPPAENNSNDQQENQTNTPPQPAGEY